jgi:hypothetical protein
MDRLRPLFHDAQRSASPPSHDMPRGMQQVQRTAGLGLLIVALFFLAGLPQSPARVSGGRPLGAPADVRYSSGSNVTQRAHMAAPERGHRTYSSDSRSAGRGGQSNDREAPPGVWAAAFRSVWTWARSLLMGGEAENARTSDEDTFADAPAGNTSLDEDGGQLASSPQRAYVLDRVDGFDVAYSRAGVDSMAGLAVLFHGCGQGARDWYELPEHRQIVRQLRKARIATVAFSAGNAVSRCWSTRFPAEKNDDAVRVARAVRLFVSNHSISPELPRYGIGISSGGTLLSILSTAALMAPLASQALYISPGSMRAFRRATADYPNTLFVHLQTDNDFASHRAISAGRRVLLGRGVRVVGEMSQRSVALHPLTLHAREPRISQDKSRRVFEILTACRARAGGPTEAAGAEGEANGDVGGATCRFDDAIRQHARDDSLRDILDDPTARRSLDQVVRVLSGQHEVSGSGGDKVVAWLRANGRATGFRRPRAHTR